MPGGWKNGRKRSEGIAEKRSEHLWEKETTQREKGRERCGMCDSVRVLMEDSLSITIEITK